MVDKKEGECVVVLSVEHHKELLKIITRLANRGAYGDSADKIRDLENRAYHILTYDAIACTM